MEAKLLSSLQLSAVGRRPTCPRRSAWVGSGPTTSRPAVGSSSDQLDESPRSPTEPVLGELFNKQPCARHSGKSSRFLTYPNAEQARTANILIRDRIVWLARRSWSGAPMPEGSSDKMGREMLRDGRPKDDAVSNQRVELSPQAREAWMRAFGAGSSTK